MTGASGPAPAEPPAALREAWERYLALLQKVADFWDRAVAAQPGAFACREGCSACCGPGLTVLPVEAEAIRAHLGSLGREERRALAARLAADRPGKACAFLVEDRCAVYAARPVICRTHGLALRVEERVDHCPRCFVDETPRPEGILSLETINVMLVLVNRHWLAVQGEDQDSPRVALAALALEAASQEG